MYVVKRDGRKEPVKFDKITARINKLSYGLNTQFCDPVSPCWRHAGLELGDETSFMTIYLLCAGPRGPESGHGRLPGGNNERAGRACCRNGSSHDVHASRLCSGRFKCIGTLSSCGACLTLRTFLIAAGSQDRGLQLAQEHPEVLLNDVSISDDCSWPIRNFQRVADAPISHHKNCCYCCCCC